MEYNINFELVAAVYMAVLLFFIKTQYSSKSELNRLFENLVFMILITDILDVTTAITIQNAGSINSLVNVIFNSLYFISNATLAFVFMEYVLCFISTTYKSTRVFRINLSIYIIYLVCILGNIIGGYLFSFSDSGEYVHETLYILVYIIPIYYILSSGLLLLKDKKTLRKKQRYTIFIFCALAILGPVVQLLFLPDVLLSLFSASIAALIMFFSLETPDYQLLLKTIDELEETKKKAEIANRTKTEFLANMSHEIRTPIHIMLGYSEMIEAETKESHSSEYAANIRTSGRTLLSIVNDILDFAGIEDGNTHLENDNYSVYSLLQDIISYSEYHTEKKGLEFRLELDENIPAELYGDVTRMTQILNNLLSNAIKYTKEGFVEFKMSWKPLKDDYGTISVEVTDSGTGMHPEDIKKITESFSRLDKKKNHNIQGIGLGLTIVKKLLELMDSELKVESEYGKGSKFSFCVKQKVTDSSPIGKIKRRNESYKMVSDSITEDFTAPDARILAADDNVMNLDLLKGILKDTQIKLDTAINGEEALNLLKSGRYDIILLDHMMPVMDGVETLNKIKEENLAPETPVIVLTANAVAGVKEKYLEAGFDDYLSKPIIGKQLKGLIRHYLPDGLVHYKKDNENIKNEPENVQDSETQQDSFLSRLNFLDTATGMTYCCDSEDFYKEMLQSFLNEDKKSDLEKMFNDKDWENYRITVHALKSTSLSIGAVDVSGEAKQLEDAAKNLDADYIENHHKGLMENYSTLLDNINTALNGQPKQDTPQDSDDTEDSTNILVVDDDAMNLRIAEKMLMPYYKISCVKSGFDALDYVKKTIPDLILLDLHMPQMDGFQVLEQLKKDEKTKSIPVIFLTADNDRDVEVKGFKEGALDFITKPFISDIMIERVNRILELDRLQRHLEREVQKQTRKAEKRREQVERLYLQIMKTLASAIDAKDKYTNGHSVRVAEYSKEIAKRAGKSEQEQEDIYYIGLLHDIVKIGIPDEIINKSSGLTDEEYAIIKSHPVIGAEILQNISDIKGIDIGARWHHEKYDGSGYPDGKKGEDIPEIARIIGVADAYDAMASKRSYRDVLPQDVIKADIEKNKGAQFDPYFADILIQMIDEDTEYNMREQ